MWVPPRPLSQSRPRAVWGARWRRTLSASSGAQWPEAGLAVAEEEAAVARAERRARLAAAAAADAAAATANADARAPAPQEAPAAPGPEEPAPGGAGAGPAEAPLSGEKVFNRSRPPCRVALGARPPETLPSPAVQTKSAPAPGRETSM